MYRIHDWMRTAAHIAVIAAVTIVVAGCTKKQTGDASPRGMTYDSLRELPDFSGWWYWEIPFGTPPTPYARAPFKPEIAAFLQEFVARIEAGTIVDPVALGAKPHYCQPPRFSGVSGGFAGHVEFLFTPGRVTIASEDGLIRRVSLAAGPLPAVLNETNAGTSIASWEGKTLVIETAGLDRNTPFLLGLKMGRNVRVTERISLKGPDLLEIALRVTAPELFTAPFDTKLQYRRDRTHVFHDAISCTDDDRSVDPATGQQRFDMTPPEDLPPPPSGRGDVE